MLFSTVVGLGLELDLASGCLMVIHTYLYYTFRCHCHSPYRY